MLVSKDFKENKNVLLVIRALQNKKINHFICYNILSVLYKHDRDILLKYCDELNEQCDGMAKHRIKRIMEEVMR